MSTAHPFQTDDPRLVPVHAKVLAGERLGTDDALALYRSGDILAVGWMANHVRERLHGDKTYFNVNRHLNPTNVCVAACRLCAFGRKKDSPGAYTMALEEAFEEWAALFGQFMRLAPARLLCLFIFESLRQLRRPAMNSAEIRFAAARLAEQPK